METSAAFFLNVSLVGVREDLRAPGRQARMPRPAHKPEPGLKVRRWARHLILIPLARCLPDSLRLLIADHPPDPTSAARASAAATRRLAVAHCTEATIEPPRPLGAAGLL